MIPSPVDKINDSKKSSQNETCLVKCYNASLRSRFARFNRKTKLYSKSFEWVKEAVLMWVNRDLLLNNITRYAGINRYC